MNARATRRPRGRAGTRPGGRTGGRNSKGPVNGCGLAALFGASALLGALGYGITQAGGWL